ncbi:MAG: ATP-binding protein, partial [Candidatus Latescibacterota bacterium]
MESASSDRDVKPVQPVLAGREAEMARLRHGLGRAAAGRGSVVLVSGETGLGKTRLLEELGRQAREDDMLFLGGGGEQSRSALPYGAFVGVLRGYLRHGTLRERQALQQAVEEGAPQLHGSLVPVPHRNGSGRSAGDSPELRRRLFLARLAARLFELGQRCPLAVCL